MSTSLIEIKGQIEIPRKDGSFTCDYVNKSVHFCSFSGGIKRGHSLQITIGSEAHIQLDNESVKKLISILQETYLSKNSQETYLNKIKTIIFYIAENKKDFLIGWIFGAMFMAALWIIFG